MPEKHKRKHLTSFQMIILGFGRSDSFGITPAYVTRLICRELKRHLIRHFLLQLLLYV